MMSMGCHNCYAEMLLKVRAQGEGSFNKRRNAIAQPPFPINHRGPSVVRRNAKKGAPPPVLFGAI